MVDILPCTIVQKEGNFGIVCNLDNTLKLLKDALKYNPKKETSGTFQDISTTLSLAIDFPKQVPKYLVIWRFVQNNAAFTLVVGIACGIIYVIFSIGAVKSQNSWVQVTCRACRIFLYEVYPMACLIVFGNAVFNLVTGRPINKKWGFLLTLDPEKKFPQSSLSFYPFRGDLLFEFQNFSGGSHLVHF
jgi:hypothetical protein